MIKPQVRAVLWTTVLGSYRKQVISWQRIKYDFTARIFKLLLGEGGRHPGEARARGSEPRASLVRVAQGPSGADQAHGPSPAERALQLVEKGGKVGLKS